MNPLIGKKSIPDTAGKILTEQDILTYLYCPKYYSFDREQTVANIQQRLLKSTYEKLAVRSLRDPYKNVLEFSTKITQFYAYKYGREHNMTESEITVIQNQNLLYLHEILQILKKEHYELITGPLPFKVKVHKTLIEFTISGAYRTRKNQTIHYIDFFPHTSNHAFDWNPMSYLKTEYLKQFISDHSFRPNKCVGHIFSAVDGGEHRVKYWRLEDKEVNENSHKYLHQIIANMEVGYALPKFPCKEWNCKYRQRCVP